MLMNTTRNGKIARLPRPVREALNQRLDNGELGAQLAAWLNALPEVQTVLAVHFDGSPINEQNLSAWKQGGFADWQRHEEAREWVGRLVEDADDLETLSGHTRLADRFAIPVLMELAMLLRKAVASDDPVEQRKTILGVAQQLSHLRRADHQTERLSMAKERLEMKKEEVRRKQGHDDRWREGVKAIIADFFPDGVDKPARTGGLAPDIAHCLAVNDRLRREAGLPPGELSLAIAAASNPENPVPASGSTAGNQGQSR